MNNTICKPSDLKQVESLAGKYGKVCSRCRKRINGHYFKIRPSFETAFRRNKFIYYYHFECLNESLFMMRLNYFKFWILYKWERLHHKMVFLEYFGLSYNQCKSKRKGNKNV